MSNAAGASPQSAAPPDRTTTQDALVQTSLDHLDQGICIVDRDLRFVLANSRFVELLDLPENLIRPGTTCEEVFRFNAERGEYGPGNVEELVRERVDLAKKFELLRFERVRPDGTVLEIVGNPLPGGGSISRFTDITERKRAEEASYILSREKELILNAVGEGIYGLDLEGRTTFVNPAAARMIGWTPAELIGMPQHAVLHHTKPDGSPYPREECPIYAAFKDGKVHQVSDEVFWRKDGTRFPVEYVSTPIREDGKLIGAVVVFTDITERKRAERTETQFRQAIETLSEGFALFDPDDRLVLCNDKYRELFPLVAELIRPGVRFDELARASAERGQNFDALGDPESWVRRRLAAHGVAEGTFEHQMADGRWLWAIEKKAPDGYTMSTYIDITERKRAEDRLRDAIECIADGLILFDADDRVVMWNQRFADMYSELAPLLPTKPTAEELFRERYRVGTVGEFDVPVEEYVQWRMEMRQREGGTPAVHRHSDGRWFRTTERRTTEGGIVAISTDVSELKNSEMALRQAKEQAELATRAKSEFLANMSHELRTPLNAIIGFSEVTVQGIFGPVGHPKYIEYARDINTSGQHLLDLINDILDLSKIEAGKAELDEQMIDIPRIVKSCLSLVKERSQRAGLTLQSELPEGLPSLRADERKLKQILINLLSNAIKFTPLGGAVALTASVEPGEGFSIRVSDTGIGMAPEDIATALDPFGQVEGSLTRRHEGTGLGLPLTKALVELHGGVLELESEPGVGTTATVHFPAERMRERAA